MAHKRVMSHTTSQQYLTPPKGVRTVWRAVTRGTHVGAKHVEVPPGDVIVAAADYILARPDDVEIFDVGWYGIVAFIAAIGSDVTRMQLSRREIAALGLPLNAAGVVGAAVRMLVTRSRTTEDEETIIGATRIVAALRHLNMPVAAGKAPIAVITPPPPPAGGGGPRPRVVDGVPLYLHPAAIARAVVDVLALHPDPYRVQQVVSPALESLLNVQWCGETERMPTVR